MKNIYLPSSETWIHTDNGEITGFISIVDGRHIATLFIAPVWQRKGIGRMLLDHVKAIYSCLTLAVYERNQNALDFYESQGFLVKKKEINTETGECEHVMMWTHAH